jgi:hypothetical protein
MPISGPAAAVLPSAWAAAVMPTSEAPNTTPTSAMISTRRRIAAARSEPPCGRSPAGRQWREAGSSANATVPEISSAAAAASATPVEVSAPASRTPGGPAIQVSSDAAASTA